MILLNEDPQRLKAIARYHLVDQVNERELYCVVSNNQKLMIFYDADGRFDHLRRLSVPGIDHCLIKILTDERIIYN